MRRKVVALLIFVLAFLLVSEAFAQRRRRAPRRRARPQPAQQVTVPFNVGVGPAAFFMTGPVQNDQLVHTGVIIDLFAVIDRELIRKFANRIPREYRAAAMRQEEVRFRPSELALAPSNIIISPKVDGYSDTGIYGLTLRPIGVGTAVGGGSKGVRLGLRAGLDLTYMFIHSDTLPTTHFLRPGIDLEIDFEVKITRSFLISVGWRSTVYPPQEVGGSIIEWGELDQSIWHVGQAFLKIHQRIPVTRRF